MFGRGMARLYIESKNMISPNEPPDLQQRLADHDAFERFAKALMLGDQDVVMNSNVWEEDWWIDATPTFRHWNISKSDAVNEAANLVLEDLLRYVTVCLKHIRELSLENQLLLRQFVRPTEGRHD